MGKLKVVVACVLVLLILGTAGGVVWWMNTPHTAQEQF